MCTTAFLSKSSQNRHARHSQAPLAHNDRIRTTAGDDFGGAAIRELGGAVALLLVPPSRGCASHSIITLTIQSHVELLTWAARARTPITAFVARVLTYALEVRSKRTPCCNVSMCRPL
jgi:hypothetical protein